MADLRNLIETRMFSKSERTLEKIGLENEPVSQCKPLENSVWLDSATFTQPVDETLFWHFSDF